jgi:hypothetical protein
MMQKNSDASAREIGELLIKAGIKLIGSSALFVAQAPVHPTARAGCLKSTQGPKSAALKFLASRPYELSSPGHA